MSNFVSMRNIRFMIKEVFDTKSLTDYEYYGKHNEKMFDMVIDAAMKLAVKLMYPVLEEMDQNQPVLENGQVKVHKAVKKIMKEFGQGGWIASGFSEEHGGDQIPLVIRGTASFIFSASNYSASAYPELTAGAAELITSFGSQELIDTYVPKMIDGKWQGTMALTEPQAGSSLTDITTTAWPDGKGRFKIKGVKTFISAGDHDCAENIIHLMLVRIENSPAGAKGISLFVVPKKRFDEKKNLISNDITVASIYHKLGYRGTPAAEISMGEKDDCYGWLVGNENKGLSHMFQMMNGARILVGLASSAIASAAYLAALEYTQKRPQGRPVTLKDPLTSQIPIIEHADVKRMLLFQKSVIEGSFSLVLQCCMYADLIKVSKGDEKEKYELLLDLLTPVAKSFPSEYGISSISNAIQCFGGYGYCEDFPVEQYFRDIRIHAIHEGTTGIQGMDLLGRKILMKNGKASWLFIEEVSLTIREAMETSQLQFFAKELERAMKQLEKVAGFLFNVAREKGIDVYLSDASLFLEFYGLIVISWQWLIQGITAKKALSEKCSKKDNNFYNGKIFTMNYFFRYELPKIQGLATRLMDKDNLTINMKTEYFKD
ncbi:MAG: acyl-CoA dehydrogenase [Desulfobacula sp.]|uniref:acyl-CoA dehydrogenase n=1 Tax=Desulfobacula sp. TaxID=2593537 RepID=UPI001DCFCFD4|nr:acyl-CoA dehydrogenase [Desulfobacula sp.]MBT3485692.1 acyl-CoA dehydrogenase [Desulfobacula sp.]MBT3806273.1 acyl-CoA dehydrogenase [Desulfobacula sp.]MBT4027034.1 acyl-CoA dehydrogenase [Desulfobacula sp.]MBT4199257.1 acyl-CoA dehydrogenase [Desulfobacula sp.]